MENVFLTSLTTPEIRELFREELSNFFPNINLLSQTTQSKQPKFITMKEAEFMTGRSANALRVQISLGHLKSVKQGSRHYFDREYLENWISGSYKIDANHG